MRLLAEFEASHGNRLTIGTISERTGIPADLVVPEVERLIDDGYVPGELKRLMSGGDVRPWYLTKARLTGRGARALHIWPEAEVFVTVLNQLAEAETDPDKRSKLRELATAVKDVGVQVVSEVLVAAAEHYAGLK